MQSSDLDTSTRPQTLQQIDAKILKANEDASRWMELRNNIIPFACLPNELLQRAFLFLCRSQAAERTEPIALAFSQVCRTWRHAALAHAALWACIPLSQESLSKKMLRRAVHSPLIMIYTADNSALSGQPFQDVISSGRMIRDLQLSNIKPMLLQSVCDQIETLLKSLRYIYLSRCYHGSASKQWATLQQLLKSAACGLLGLSLSRYTLEPCYAVFQI